MIPNEGEALRRGREGGEGAAEGRGQLEGGGREGGRKGKGKGGRTFYLGGGIDQTKSAEAGGTSKLKTPPQQRSKRDKNKQRTSRRKRDTCTTETNTIGKN